jgi:hypothetical protein
MASDDRLSALMTIGRSSIIHLVQRKKIHSFIESAGQAHQIAV